MLATRAHSFAIAAALTVILATAILAGAGCSKSSNSGYNPAAPAGGVAEPFDSGAMANGVQFVHMFPTAGAYGYHCSIHTSMTATVTVAAAGADSAIVSIAGFAFSPNAVTIKPGGYVHWTNHDGTTHTVTRP